jgi:hypothetical protein
LLTKETIKSGDSFATQKRLGSAMNNSADESKRDAARFTCDHSDAYPSFEFDANPSLDFSLPPRAEPKAKIRESLREPSVAAMSDDGSVDQDSLEIFNEAEKGALHMDIFVKIQDFRNLSGKIVNDDRVQLFIVVLIAINAAMMGLGTFPFVKDDPNIERIFTTADTVFLSIFTVELAMNLIFHGLHLFLDGWLVFDFVIIVASWSFDSVQIIRAFRIFRALRLVTRVKVMKNLVLALFDVMPRMGAICLLLGLIYYIFAVMFTQLFGSLYDEGVTEIDYFSRLDLTLFTLFQIMTLDSWGAIARQVSKKYDWAWIPFTVFVTASGFIVVNLIIAVICDAVSNLDHDDRAAILGKEEKHEAEAPKLDIRDQYEVVNEQFKELKKLQTQTFHTLEYMMRHMELKKQGSAMTLDLKDLKGSNRSLLRMVEVIEAEEASQLAEKETKKAKDKHNRFRGRFG